MNLNKTVVQKDNVFSKNVAKGVFDETQIDKGFFVLCYQNDSNTTKTLTRDVDHSFIQFHFCVKGSCKFNFNNGAYTIDVFEEKGLLLYNPQLALPLCLQVIAKSWLVSVLISIKRFHRLFSQEADYITFLSRDNKDKKFYKDSQISPSIAIILNQLLHYNLNQSIKTLYFKGKIYELLSLYFNKGEGANIEQCPFLADETNVFKIRKAKEIIVSRYYEPPSLQEIAEEIGLSLKKLKEGFKQIYGDTVFGFLVDYKMEVARKLLETGLHNVNEVGLKVGYSTSSHFIAAFKKKFGTTPKKYVMSV